MLLETALAPALRMRAAWGCTQSSLQFRLGVCQAPKGNASHSVGLMSQKHSGSSGTCILIHAQIDWVNNYFGRLGRLGPAAAPDPVALHGMVDRSIKPIAFHGA